jgi:hypothetical protein
VTVLNRHRYSIPVIVSVTQAWTNTGIPVVAGDTIEISVKGLASTAGTDPRYPAWYGPEGNGRDISPSFFNVPGVASASVIGKVGASGQGFYVGSVQVVRTNATGTVYLGYNDDPTNPGAWADNYGYYVAFVSTRGIVTGFQDGPDHGIPEEHDVSQNYPNPFNPSTSLRFVVPGRSRVNIAVYNTAGQMIKTLLDEDRDAGEHTVRWDGKSDQGGTVASGAYFCQVRIGDFLQTKKMLLVK